MRLSSWFAWHSIIPVYLIHCCYSESLTCFLRIVCSSLFQFDMLLGRLEKDGSRKVGRLFLWSPPLISAAVVVFLLHAFASHLLSCHASLFFFFLCFTFFFCHSFFCSMWEFQSVRQGQKHLLHVLTLFHCHLSKSSLLFFIVAFASKVSWHFSQRLQHSERCDVWGSFLPLTFSSLYVSSHPLC